MRVCCDQSLERVHDGGMSGIGEDVAALYDDWAEDYEAMHADWAATIRRHGSLLAEALEERGVVPPATVLDCTCGTGTQAIGLSLNGYAVSGADISARELELARSTASRYGVDVPFALGDLLQPPGPGRPLFDAVLTANSLTHFHDEATLRLVLANAVASIKPGGLFATINRDYDEPSSRVTSTAPQSSVRDGRRRVSFQLWEWDDAQKSYRMDSLLLTAAYDPASHLPPVWETRSRSVTLRAWRRADIEVAALDAGLVDVVWHETAWQPIMTAVRPAD
jgi:glycine/sarcosine N-methyltransferase